MALILPLLPLRDIIVFPHMVVPLFVGRGRSIAALENALANDRQLLLSAQRVASQNNPTQDDIFDVGTIAHIAKLHRLEDNNVKVLVEGRSRAKITNFTAENSFYKVEYEPIIEDFETDCEDIIGDVRSAFESYVKLNRRIPPEMLVSVQSIHDPRRLADTIVAHLSVKLKEKQKLLEMSSAKGRLVLLEKLMKKEVELLQVERKIRSRVKRQMEKSQKEFNLNEQMQAVQKELGDRDEFKNELIELEKRVREKDMSAEAVERCLKELRKLKQMAPISAEATVLRGYIEWVLALPWKELKEEQGDTKLALTVLDEDHFGLEKIKERIIEYLAVRSLVEKPRGPVLCLVGPPGVGKTSLAKSIARATNRDFIRVSLGGVKDESEIRGHRRTYIGALPGKIIQSLKKCGSNNPVFLLDEIDKMTQDFRGDPASALLEVLDPEQNETFVDHYLDLDYDLSQIMFIATANVRNRIPLPLQDRLEIIELSSYTQTEKVEIAKRYLLPKQQEANGIANLNLNITDEVFENIVNHYTREAGVRNLEQKVATVCRKLAREWLEKGKPKHHSVDVTDEKVNSLLGVKRFSDRNKDDHSQPGLVNGLAVTAFGGSLLPAEVSILPGKGKLILTGKLGETMQESAQAAISYIRSRASNLGLPNDFASKVDIHVHFPEGAIPKDGPSAGVTMTTAITSALLKIPVKHDVAMTGEVTLRGRVLKIGGLKEKLIAAARAGVTTVVIPKSNEGDLAEVPEPIKDSLSIHCAEHMDEVLSIALDSSIPFAQLRHSVVDWRDSYADETSNEAPMESSQRPH